jgi:hypothetical protein
MISVTAVDLIHCTISFFKPDMKYHECWGGGVNGLRWFGWWGREWEGEICHNFVDEEREYIEC